MLKKNVCERETSLYVCAEFNAVIVNRSVIEWRCEAVKYCALYLCSKISTLMAQFPRCVWRLLSTSLLLESNFYTPNSKDSAMEIPIVKARANFTLNSWWLGCVFGVASGIWLTQMQCNDSMYISLQQSLRYHWHNAKLLTQMHHMNGV